jgi:hypothetical protein
MQRPLCPRGCPRVAAATSTVHAAANKTVTIPFDSLTDQSRPAEGMVVLLLVHDAGAVAPAGVEAETAQGLGVDRHDTRRERHQYSSDRGGELKTGRREQPGCSRLGCRLCVT